LADFSSCGPTRDGRQSPTLTAPGDEIISTIPLPADFGPMKGTSMSAPLVAGAAALMLQLNPGLTAEDVRKKLVQTARSDDQTRQGSKNQWGAGKLDVRKALASVRPSAPVQSKIQERSEPQAPCAPPPGVDADRQLRAQTDAAD
jgi:subtilisin family serine protease